MRAPAASLIALATTVLTLAGCTTTTSTAPSATPSLTEEQQAAAIWDNLDPRTQQQWCADVHPFTFADTNIMREKLNALYPPNLLDEGVRYVSMKCRPAFS